MSMRRTCAGLFVLMLTTHVAWAQVPAGTALSYQGRLAHFGVPLDGADQADIQFTLYAGAAGGMPVAGPITIPNVDFDKGLFSVQVDFGSSAFNGEERWIEIASRTPAGSGAFTTLTPRQPVTPAPYALFALSGGGGDGHSLDASDGSPEDALFVDPNGSVGIGTLTPSSALDVVGVITSSGGSGGNVRTLNPLNQGASISFSWLNNVPRLRYGGSGAGSANGLDIQKVGDVSLLRILDNGNVGIGTTTPANRLTVNGSVRSLTGGFVFPDGTTQTTAATGGAAGWSLFGNSATDPNTNFLGTLDSAPLHLRVNNVRAMRLEPGLTSPNLLGGSAGNVSAPLVSGAAISGGGTAANPNRVNDDYSTVGGGLANTAGVNDLNPANQAYATVAGGTFNAATGMASTVGGGQENQAGAEGATVGGGVINTAMSNGATVAGGLENHASGQYATISGGAESFASATYSTVSGGVNNNASQIHATIGGGQNNKASGGSSTVAGGANNTASAGSASIGGGFNNLTSGIGGVVAGGAQNQVIASYGTIAGGGWDGVSAATGNRVTDAYGTVGGGSANQAGEYAVVAGGLSNAATGDNAAVGGGGGNQAGGLGATISGGSFNIANGDAAAIPGGLGNRANGATSLASGNRAKADHAGAFVWGDSTAADFVSTAVNQFLVRAAGGFGLGTNDPRGALHILAPAIAPPSSLAAGNNGLLLGTNGTASYKWIQSYGGALVLNSQGNNVGVGTAAPSARLDVLNTNTAQPAASFSSTGSGAGLGVAGNTTGTAGIAVWGFASSATGNTRGVQGMAQSGSGVGVLGYAASISGTNIGVQGETLSPNGTGVLAKGSAPTGTALTVENGAIRVPLATSSSSTPAFLVTSSASNTFSGGEDVALILIDNPLLDGNPDRVVLVSPNGKPGTSAGTFQSVSSTVSAFFLTQDASGGEINKWFLAFAWSKPLTELHGMKFSVLVITP
jgi:hypothetical protein